MGGIKGGKTIKIICKTGFSKDTEIYDDNDNQLDHVTRAEFVVDAYDGLAKMTLDFDMPFLDAVANDVKIPEVMCVWLKRMITQFCLECGCIKDQCKCKESK